MPIGASFTKTSLFAATDFATVVGWRLWAQTLVNLFAGWAYWELLWVAARYPNFAAKRGHRNAKYGALYDLLFAHIVRVTFVVTWL
jgi:hypothetical protein